ncbi:Zinc finger, RING-type [Corchorus olitorius]|uniref:RING-type E3 ubiquitin transferase n=1 Tax=Corchorus olitorius TaxID=93759 RepID=A0A1R3ILG5_9ROSI|nr:Zinc finger, RING-type [Corchorus olitorius]
MVLNKLVAFIYNLIGGRVHIASARIKDDSSYVVMKQEMSKMVEQGLASEGEICSVCLSSMKEGDGEMRVLPCLHQFHRVCVDRWLNRCRKNCPICRFSMGEEERFHRREAFTEEMIIWFSSFHVAGF